MLNNLVSEILNEIADILELQNVQWKPRAYRKAALVVETLAEDISKVDLKKLPGIGESIGAKIQEIIDTGDLKYLHELKKKLPIDIEALNEIEGLGPKTIKKLYTKLGVKNIKDLEKAAKKGLIEKLKGLGPKVQANILDNIKFKKLHTRTLYVVAKQEADSIVDSLKPYVSKIQIAGSLARKKITIGDIDILAIDKKNVISKFVSLNNVRKVLAKGSTKASVILNSGIQVDLRVLKKESFGSGLNYFIGSKEHNVHLRRIAIKKGMKLSEYGLFKGEKQIAGADEKKIYSKLGLNYVPPELREDRGEIENNFHLPKLITRSDIKGDLQIHTTASDGSASIKEMADSAVALGHKYVAITDHTGSLAIAHGLKDTALLKHWTKIDNTKTSIDVLKSAEVNILSDGSLDTADSVLKKGDIILAAIHGGFKQSKEKMTNRLIKAISNPNVDVIAHPTGRIVNRRPGYSFDFDKVLQACKDHNTCLEIDCNPYRMDLNDYMVKRAVDYGVKLSIGTDAHSIDGLKNIDLGVNIARRGWCEKKNVINCLSLDKLKKMF